MQFACGIGSFWAMPYRPLFPAAFLCAVTVVLIWPLGAEFGWDAPSLGTPALWHAHELLFGFGGAAVGGYMLTALPSWTGSRPFQGRPLQLLMLFWCLSRLVCANGGQLPVWAVLLPGLGYFLFLAAILARAIISAKEGRKAGFVAVVLALGFCDALLLISSISGAYAQASQVAGAMILVFSMLIVVIGAKAIPAFSRNWMLAVYDQKGDDTSPAPWVVVLCIAIGTVSYLVNAGMFGGLALLLAAGILVRRMQTWFQWETLTNPLLTALNAAFLWLPFGLSLIAVAVMAPSAFSTAAALHAITVGAMGCLIMAITARAAAKREKGVLHARHGFALCATLIWLASVSRLAAPLLPDHYSPVISASALMWCLGWLAFTITFIPALIGPPNRPVLSGNRIGNLRNN